jgi:hypothetical protein
MKLPRKFARHAPLYAKNPTAVCWSDDQSPVLRNQALAAHQSTDILLIEGRALCGHGSRNSLGTTMAVALQIAGARLLSIDSRELGCLIVPVSAGEASVGIVLFDNVPGGAGHVRELMEMGRPWLEAAAATLRGSPEHDARCHKACLECIMTFEAQVHAQLGLLDRRAALEALSSVLSLAAAVR